MGIMVQAAGIPFFAGSEVWDGLFLGNVKIMHITAIIGDYISLETRS